MNGLHSAVELLGIKRSGCNADNGKKLLFTFLFTSLVLLLSRSLRALTRWMLRRGGNERTDFWTRQTFHLATTALLLVGILSVRFDDPGES
jgi:hypothetical protein